MGRAPCCEKQGLKRGPWSPEEDKLLLDYIQAHGYGTWSSLPRLAGLLRCGKSCRLRWTNYLRPDIKRGAFTPEEEKSIVQLHAIVGNKWSTIAANLQGRTDNEIKNYWNTHLKKRRLRMAGIIPVTTTTTTTTNSSPAADKSNPSPEPSADFFLRIWNSPIGDAFRKPMTSASFAAVPPPPPPHHESPLQSSNITTSNEAAAVAVAEVTSEEDSYRDYFNFAAGDSLGFFFEGQMESCYSPSSLFSDDASLVTLPS